MKNESGFSLVELMVALVILTFGILALGSTMGYVTLQVRVADLHTQRAAAVSQSGEQMRSMHYDSVRTVAYADRITLSEYAMWRTVTPVNANMKTVSIFSQGPGFKPGRGAGNGWLSTVQDTFTISIVRP
jgi:prepilin-type N-terminal cleavage/methylation domain-containing protein